jgi:hypothetical protein
MNLRKNQMGYMYEIPLIVAAVAIFLITILPKLLKYAVFGKMILVTGALIITAGLYYMIVTPGWQPSKTKRLRWPYNIIVFGIIAFNVAFAVIAVLIK